MSRFLLRFTFFLLLVYGGLCLAMYIVQDSLIYYPIKTSHKNDKNAVTVRLNDEDIVVAYQASEGERPVASGLASEQMSVEQTTTQRSMALLYFGGNAEDVSLSLPLLAKAFPRVSIHAMHYRSYGGSTGQASQKYLFADGLALYDQLKREYQTVMVMGRSLGSGVATYVASQRPVPQLILVTPFYSLEKVAQDQYPYLPVRLLLRDKFESYHYAPMVKANVLMLVAEWDQLTPLAGSVKLKQEFNAAQAVELIVIKQAWHNSISNQPGYLEALRRFGAR
ncbi:alpha/beta hydrolase [Undibacterium cyanobacteriorum]|uniref:Alpha/beta hydrolase n=1 Tax=Undibacterium cyanobacteriorum TaxID=3073561 RepID=A0ABY9RES7_9BURK|nr:alpha/beta hydrolase [Undibacterium sp. 20NA77.5]WMW79348.1 alpha/beta hydrolase [Undibacterium sp. 20NA77.5]